MLRKTKFIVVLLIAMAALFVFSACKSADRTDATYEQIDQNTAKDIMNNEENVVILDVRSQQEFDDGHIERAILIPDNEIAVKAERVLTDKSQLILVYCRSGRRSKLAAAELVKIGYTNVKEFGGIIDWKYGIVK